jgi:hypothetical protein
MRRALVLSIVLSSSCGGAGPVHETAKRPIPSSERAALLALFDATGGDRWRRRHWWQSPPGTECQWLGVTCRTEGDRTTVTALSLDENNLTGRLPDSLAMLSSLEELSLFGNQLSGTLPVALMRKFDEGRLMVAGYTARSRSLTRSAVH